MADAFRPSRRGPYTAERERRLAAGVPEKDHAEFQGVETKKLFENLLLDVLAAGEATAFRGAVDVKLELRSVEVDASGLLRAVLRGNDTKTSSVSLTLATRVYLGDPPAEPPEP